MTNEERNSLFSFLEKEFDYLTVKAVEDNKFLGDEFMLIHDTNIKDEEGEPVPDVILMLLNKRGSSEQAIANHNMIEDFLIENDIDIVLHPVEPNSQDVDEESLEMFFEFLSDTFEGSIITGLDCPTYKCDDFIIYYVDEKNEEPHMYITFSDIFPSISVNIFMVISSYLEDHLDVKVMFTDVNLMDSQQEFNSTTH